MFYNNLFDVEFYDEINIVSEMFIDIFGEQYRNDINNRLQHTFFIKNITYDCFGYLKDFGRYTWYLKSFFINKYTKKMIEFLSDNEDIYNKARNDEFEFRENYFPFAMFDEFEKEVSISALTSFFTDTSNYSDNNKDTITLYQRNLINYVLGYDRVSKENYSKFKTTDEFKEFLKWLRPQYDYYLELYEEYKKDMAPYREYFAYVENEKKKCTELRERFYDLKVKDYVMSNFKFSHEIKDIDKFLHSMFILKDSFHFSDDIFVNPENAYSKNLWIYKIAEYLESLGINIYEEFKLPNNLDDLSDSQKLIISKNIYTKYQDKFIDYKKFKEFLDSAYEDYKLEVFLNNEQKKSLVKTKIDVGTLSFQDNSQPMQFVFDQLNECNSGNFLVPGTYITINNKNYIPIFLTPDFGYIMLDYVHECCHRLFVKNSTCGFDHGQEKNKYVNRKRKYEVFNESLNDIFTAQVMERLISNGIFLFEPEEFVKRDYYTNINMPLLVKNEVKKLLNRFSDVIISNKFESNLDGLKEFFGNDIFEEFIDTINHLFSLTCYGETVDDPTNEKHDDYIKDIERIDSIIEEMEKTHKRANALAFA